MSKLSRRGFFKTLSLDQKTKSIHPPYSKNIDDFKNCQKCQDKACVNACEENIISIQNDLPVILFTQNGCNYCVECAKVCEMGVLCLEEKKQIDAIFSINTNNCFAWNGVVCSICNDYCDEKAIEFFGLFRPMINKNCTSCGFCFSPCPTNAIEFKGVL